MAGLGPWGLALSGAGSIFSYFQQQQQQQQMQQFLQQLTQNQQGIENRELGELGGLQTEANQYTSLLPGLTSLEQQSMQGAGQLAPGAAENYLKNAMSPQALASLTGINAGQLTSNATNYLSNFGGTNVGQITPQQLATLGNADTNLAGVTPGAEAFYGREASQGLNPQVQQNAQNQLQQNFNQSLASIKSSAAPGQNINAATQAAQNSLLSSSANLGSTLAGENQQVMQQGVQGQTSTASALDQQTMQRLAQQFSTAQGADAEKQNMLTGAATLGNQYNQTVLGNQQQGAQFGQQLLDQYGNFVGQGNQLNEFNAQSLGGLYSNLSQQGEYYSGMAANQAANTQNPFSSIGSLLSNYAGAASAGGSGAPDGQGEGEVDQYGNPVQPSYGLSSPYSAFQQTPGVYSPGGYGTNLYSGAYAGGTGYGGYNGYAGPNSYPPPQPGQV